MANSILRGFLDHFSEYNWQKGIANIGIFATFGGKVYDAITSSVLTILQQRTFDNDVPLTFFKVQGVRGINNSLVVFDDPGVPPVTPVQEDDQLGIVANLGPLLTVSTDLSMYILGGTGDSVAILSLPTIVGSYNMATESPVNLYYIYTNLSLVNERNERPKMIEMELSAKRVTIIRVTEASLVVITRRAINPAVFGPVVKRATELLEKGMYSILEIFRFL
jgi:hypothetical protein